MLLTGSLNTKSEKKEYNIPEPGNHDEKKLRAPGQRNFVSFILRYTRNCNDWSAHFPVIKMEIPENLEVHAMHSDSQ